MSRPEPRTLALALGDQLNSDSAIFDSLDKRRDVVWMAEVAGESTHVWTSKVRIAAFLSAMRHFRDGLINQGWTVDYRELPARPGESTTLARQESLAAALDEAIERLRPDRVIVVHPGEWRILQSLTEVVEAAQLPFEVLEDRHFYTTPADFSRHADGQKQLRMEYFYREQRKRFGVLMDGDDPVGGQWNFDKENRGAFGRTGPGAISRPLSFPSDAITSAVIDLVNERFTNHPGDLQEFDWPVTPEEAQRALADFVEHRLPSFGEFQDAMWTEEPWLYHSRLSMAMNLKLLDPREVISAAVEALNRGAAPIASVEGFVRQILGWREYVRGVYWTSMPEYLRRNALSASAELPEFYWTGETEMVCLRQSISQTLQLGYAHHIQRLMVTGLFAMLLGVDPRRVHEWYLAVYVDAVEWVEAPNTIGMSQYADGGVMGSKPYCASGKYIQRMSNYCSNCRFDPSRAVGEDACPFTTLYWDFLARNRDRLRGNNRMTMQLENVDRKQPAELIEIRDRAERLRESLAPN